MLSQSNNQSMGGVGSAASNVRGSQDSKLTSLTHESNKTTINAYSNDINFINPQPVTINFYGNDSINVEEVSIPKWINHGLEKKCRQVQTFDYIGTQNQERKLVESINPPKGSLIQKF